MKITVPQANITHEATAAALTAAAKKADELGIKVNIALAAAGGNPAGFLRMPGASLHSIDIAIDKAYTAVGFGLPTGDWPQALQAHSPAVQSGLKARPRMVAFGGGFPVRVDGQLVAGLGVSGGSEEEDEACARAALAALGL